MVRHYCHVRLHKSQTLTDWHRRPLSDEQIQYAAADVLHLPAIWRRIKKGLERRGRTEWLVEEMTRFSQPATYHREPDESALRVKGAGGLDSRGLAIARELVQVRTQLAQKYNRPVRAVVRDHLIVEIAKHRWTTVAQIRTLRGLSLRTDAVQQLADAARRACELPNDQCPVVDPVIEETDEQAALVLLVTAVLRSYCARSDLAHQLVASRQTIRDYVQAQLADGDRDRATPLSTGWRATAVGRLINSVLAGQARIRVSQEGTSRALIVEE
jgi:ribonuclease D